MPHRKRVIDSQLTAGGRPKAFGQRQQARIDSTIVLNRLAAHVNGDEEMSATQIQAARILLDRTVPILKAVEVEGNQQVMDITAVPTHVFMDSLEGESKRIK